MQQDWRDLTYLLHGTATQQAAYRALESLQIFPLLRCFDPILAGTVPLDVDIPGSDLDIICYAADMNTFAQYLSDTFSNCNDFRLDQKFTNGVPTVIATFIYQPFSVEIFGQPQPTLSQAAVRHMMIEARLLQCSSKEVRQQIRQLKTQELKTEPAFAIAFSLTGNPYQALLDLADQPEEVLCSIITSSEAQQP